ncbi:MAG: 4-demethylwyosine synthase TYW1 [Candidatus Pacearchaeota archaeon]
MIPDNIQKILKKQHYFLVGGHSAVQICRWTKKSIRAEGVCYKEKFYGIKSHLCCQMTPTVVLCPNKCLHCWRAIEYTLGNKLNGKINSPSEIIDGCIKAQRKLLIGFKIDKNSGKKQLSKADMKKYLEAQEPMQFAISLSGEPTIYPYIGDLIQELRRRGKTSFLVTNGLYPEKIKEIAKKKQLPTQLYVSVNAPNEEIYKKIHRSSMKNAWKKLNESLEFFPKLRGKTRTIFRMNLIKDLNMDESHIKEYAELIGKAKPLFVEVKGYMSIGFARERLGYEKMPTDNEMKKFVEKLSTATGLKILDSHEFSRVWVLGKEKGRLKIQKI